MFNCKKLFKLQIRPPSLILLITTSQDRWIFPSQSWEVRNSIIIIIVIIIIIIIIILKTIYVHLLACYLSKLQNARCNDKGINWMMHLISYLVNNLLKPTGYVMHHQFNIQQLYVLPTLYLCVLYLSENKQRLVPLTA